MYFSIGGRTLRLCSKTVSIFSFLWSFVHTHTIVVIFSMNLELIKTLYNYQIGIHDQIADWEELKIEQKQHVAYLQKENHYRRRNAWLLTLRWFWTHLGHFFKDYFAVVVVASDIVAGFYGFCVVVICILLRNIMSLSYLLTSFFIIFLFFYFF